MTSRFGASAQCSRLTALCSLLLFSACTTEPDESYDDMGPLDDFMHEPTADAAVSDAGEADAALPIPADDAAAPIELDSGTEQNLDASAEPLDAATPEPNDAASDPADAGDDPAAQQDAAALMDDDVDAALDEPEPEPDAATPADASAMVTFAQVQQFVFGKCSGGGPAGPGGPGGHGGIPGAGACHSGENSADGLDLLSDDAFDSLVNVSSPLFPEHVLVIPGDAEGSFLMQKLTNALPEDRSLGEPMPKGEAIRWTPLPDEELDMVREWIDQGAAR